MYSEHNTKSQSRWLETLGYLYEMQFTTIAPFVYLGTEQ